jgi:membrane protein implicated in regulation of membrane protease activity
MFEPGRPTSWEYGQKMPWQAVVMFIVAVISAVSAVVQFVGGSTGWAWLLIIASMLLLALGVDLWRRKREAPPSAWSEADEDAN